MSDTALRTIDLNLLVVLDALIREQSVTRAAERLGMTQSGASRALGRLREVLGDPLFVLEGGAMRGTARLEAIRGPLSACLAHAEAVCTPADFRPAHAEGSIAIGMPDHLAYLFCPALLRRLAVEAPHLDLVVRSFSSDWLADLRTSRVEVAFGVLRGTEPQLRARHCLEDPWVVLLREGHPALRGRWNAKKFAQGQHGVMTVTGGGTSHVDRGLARLGLTRRVSYRASSPLVVAMAAAESDLRVTTTARLAARLSRDHPLIVRRLPLDADPLRLPLVWTERMHHDPRHRWVRNLVAETVAADGE